MKRPGSRGEVHEVDSTVYHKTQAVDVMDVDDGVVLKYEGNVHVLNSTAARIYELIDGTRSYGSIVSIISEEHGGEDVESHVMEFVQSLRQAHLIHE